jgi:hypothetical protein
VHVGEQHPVVEVPEGQAAKVEANILLWAHPISRSSRGSSMPGV